MADRYDALVVGGGPAGALSALQLARRGWRTLLVERGSRHRVKACGHCLSPRAERLLERLGLLDDVAAIDAGPLLRVRIHSTAGSTPLELSAVAGRGFGRITERSALDQMLIDRAARAGVEIAQPASARIDSVDADGVTVRVDDATPRLVRAALVVGADGVASSLARATGLSDPRRAGRKYGFSFDVAAAGAQQCGIEPQTIEMFVVEHGYLGVIDRQCEAATQLHAGGLVSSDGPVRSPVPFVRSVAERFDVLRAAGLADLGEGAVRRLAACGPMPAGARRVAGNRVVLVGDAAAYAEPFTGEGMAWAIESATVLDAVLAETAPGRWASADADRYARSWARRVARRHRFARLIAAALERRWTAAVMLRPGPLRTAMAHVVARRLVA